MFVAPETNSQSSHSIVSKLLKEEIAKLLNEKIEKAHIMVKKKSHWK